MIDPSRDRSTARIRAAASGMSAGHAARLRRHLAGVALAVLGAFALNVGTAVERPVALPAPAVDNAKAAGATETAVLAGGCFWGVQGVFQRLKGVRQAVSGYAGGAADTAQYHAVSTGRTGHAESVQITFDPKEISYGEILQVFFSVVHDPTQLNRQGPDTGTQYRSEIFYLNERQKEIASAYIAQLDKAGRFPRPIVTRVEPMQGFYPAEDYHQDFLLNNPTDPYIVINDLPKVHNLQEVFPEWFRDKAVTVGQIRH